MVFNNTSIERRRQRSGMSLVEMLISVAIGGIVMAAVASLTFYTARSFAALANYGDLDRLSRNALDQMTYKIRQTDGLTSYANNDFSFSIWGTNTLRYVYDPDTRKLIEVLGNQRTVLLEECDEFKADIFARNPVNGTFNQFPLTNNANGAKLIRVSWTCSRTILGQKVNTESVQSAKIVIRKQ
jgi:prepilin-type N-terminal cleavage/methylation domain-containing protein